MKSLWILIIIVLIAGAGYYAYSQGYFGGAAEQNDTTGASLDLSVDGTSGFGQE